MKRALPMLVLLLLASVPPTIVAQSPDPGLPGPEEVPDTDEVPDPDEAEERAEDAVEDAEETADDPPGPGDATDQAEDPLATIRAWKCPADTWFQQVLQGETSWTSGTFRGSDDGCVAQWGEGTYDAGSASALSSPDLPTGHLLATDRPSPTLNDGIQTLLGTGMTPEEAGRFAAACSGILLLGDVRDVCKLGFGGVTSFDVPELRPGAGALYLTMEHAWSFDSPNAQDVASDGGWLEVKTPDGSWTRIDPVAAYATVEDGERMLCASTQAFWPYADNTQSVSLSESLPFFFFSDPTDWDSESTWYKECRSLARTGHTSQFVAFSDDDIPADTANPSDTGERFRGYPGIVRGHGRGFVGDSSSFSSEEPELVEHWFDLAPYAGDTIQVRTHAVSGPGVGQRSGGWWIDDLAVEYGGPPADLGVVVAHPDEDESYPPGELPVETEVVNLGRTESQPVDLVVDVGGMRERVSVPALDPLDRHRSTSVFPANETGRFDVQASLTAEDAPPEAPVPGDAYPANNQANATAVVEVDDRVRLHSPSVQQDGTSVSVNLTVENAGNRPLSVPLEASVAPIDRQTRTVLEAERVPLGPVDTVQVPPSRDVVPGGATDANRSAAFETTLPGPGVWQISVSSPTSPDARATAVAPVGTSAPPALVDRFTGVTTGPTPTLDRGGFETDEGTYTVQLRDPFQGPDTRFVPEGDAALATFGEDAPFDVQHNQRRGLTVGTGEEHCDDSDVLGAFDPDLCPFFGEFQPDSKTVAAAPPEEGIPASVKTWNVRQHHTTVFNLSLQQVLGGTWMPGDSLEFGFDQAAQVDWEGEQGSRAQAFIVRASNDTDVVDAFRDAQNTTIHGIPNATVREAVGDAVRGANVDLLLDALLDGTLGVSKVPRDACNILELAESAADLEGRSLCGTPTYVSSSEDPCVRRVDFVEADCPLPEDDVAGHARLLRETSDTIAHWETREPSGWNHVDLPASEVVRQVVDETDDLEIDEDGVPTGKLADSNVYVVFDLVTVSDFEEVLASAEAETDPDRTQPEVHSESPAADTCERVDDTTCPPHERQLDAQDVGWEPDVQPLWTVDNMTARHEREDTLVRERRLCDEAPTSAPRINKCPAPLQDAIPPAGMQGWVRYEADDGSDLAWEHGPLVGDGEGLAPGAFNWTGASTEDSPNAFKGDGTIGTDELVIHHRDRPSYQVLQTPRIDLGGYDKPVAQIHAKFDELPGAAPPGGEPPEGTVTKACQDQSETAEGRVYTRIGWNVRARIVQPDGSLSEPRTVTPERGYDNCSTLEGGDVPVLFNGTAILERPPAVIKDRTSVTPRESGSLCHGDPPPDPTNQCVPTRLAFGHDQPVFGLEMNWTDVQLDLSPFRGEQVVLEVHAMGVSDIDRKVGELRVDDIQVQEGNPPLDVSVDHERQPFIAPGTQEIFNLAINNTGSAVVEDATARRVVIGGDGCQAVEPTVVPIPLTDPDTGLPGLPPGKNVTFSSSRLGWEAPAEELAEFERRLVVETGTDQTRSALPEFDVAPGVEDGRAVTRLTAVDADDCPSDLAVQTEVVQRPGDADVRRDGVSVVAGFDGGSRALDGFFAGVGKPIVRVTAEDAWGMSSRPAFVTPPPPLTGARVEPPDIRLTASSPHAPGTVVAGDADDLRAPLSGDLDDNGNVLSEGALCFVDEGGDGVRDDDTDPLVYQVDPETPGDCDAAVESNDIQLSGGRTRAGSTVGDDAVGKPLVDVGGSSGEPCGPEKPNPTCIEYADVDGDGRFTVEDTAYLDVVNANRATVDAGDLRLTPYGSEGGMSVVEADDADGGLSLDGVLGGADGETDQSTTPLGSGAGLSIEDPLAVQFHDSDRDDRFGGRDTAYVNVDLDNPGEAVPDTGSADARLLKSAPEGRVEVAVEPPSGLPHWSVYVGTGDGIRHATPSLDDGGAGTVTLDGMAPGTYSGYVTFDAAHPAFADAYKPLTFTVTEEPPIEADPNDADNTVRLQGLTRSQPDIEISSIDAPRVAASGAELPVPVTVENTGNTPLRNVTVTATLSPASSVQDTGAPVPVLNPGETARFEEINLNLGAPGPQRVLVSATSDENVVDRSGERMLVAREQVLPTGSNPDPGWNLAGEPTFGDGLRVPADARDDLPLDGSLDLRRSPVSALQFNVSADLEHGFDGVALSLTDASDGSERLFPFEDTLTSSHRGAEPGRPVPALTGELDGTVTAWSTDLASGNLEKAGRIDADRWGSFGSLSVGEPISEASGQMIWFPTVAYRADGGAVEQEARVPLTLETWCRIVEHGRSGQSTLTLETVERRLMSDEWDVEVSLVSGTLSPSGISRPLAGTRVSALADEDVTDWGRVRYEFDLRPVLPALLSGDRSWSRTETSDKPASCDAPESKLDTYAELPTNAYISFEAERQEAPGPSLDLGWFVNRFALQFGATGNDRVEWAGSDFDEAKSGWTGSECGFDSASQPTFGPDKTSPTVMAYCANPPKDTPLKHSSGVPRIIDWSGSSASIEMPPPPGNDRNNDVAEWLNPLLEERPFETRGSGGDQVLALDGDAGHYADATSVVDLRAVREDPTRTDTPPSAVLVLNVTAARTQTFLQVAASPTPVDEDVGESAPSRSDWEALEFLTDDQVEDLPWTRTDIPALDPFDCLNPTRLDAETPLGARDGAFTGPTRGEIVQVRDVRSDSPGTICVDLGPLTGHLGEIVLRSWTPGRLDGAGDDPQVLTLEDSTLWLATPGSTQLEPTLRGLTDRTIPEGTFELRERSRLSAEPRFVHAVDARLEGATDFAGAQVLGPDAIPSLTVDVSEPGPLSATGDLAVNVCIEFEDDKRVFTPNEKRAGTCLDTGVREDRGTLVGNLTNVQSSFEGDETLEIPWSKLLEARPVLQEERPPTIPDNVTRIVIEAAAKPQRLLSTPNDCPTDVDALASSDRPECRVLADPNPLDDRARLVIEGPAGTGNLPPTPGIHRLEVTPDRAPEGTPRTAEIALVNPTGSPRGLAGNLTIVQDGRVLSTTRVPGTVVAAYTGPDDPARVEVPIEVPEDETTTMEVEATVHQRGAAREGSQTHAVDDYRTTTRHESENLGTPFSLEGSGSASTGPEWAVPPLPGEQTDRVGARIEAGPGQTAGVRVASATVSQLRNALDKQGHKLSGGNQDGSDRAAAYVALQHQRLLPNGSDINGKWGLMGLAAVPDTPGGNDINSGNAQPLEGYAPGSTVQRPRGPPASQNDGPPCNAVTGAGEAPEYGNWGFQEGAPVIMGNTKGIAPETRNTWQTAVFPITERMIDAWAERADEDDGEKIVHFDLVVGTCVEADASSVVLADQVELVSSLPLTGVAEQQVAPSPGVVKEFKFLLQNRGSGSDAFHVVPTTAVPDDWEMSIQGPDGTVLYDSSTGSIQPITLEQGDNVTATWTVRVPQGLAGSTVLDTAIVAYPVGAPGLVSGASTHNYLASQDGDLRLPGTEDLASTAQPGQVSISPFVEPLPDLTVDAKRIVVEDAEVGAKTAISVSVENSGPVRAQGVRVAAAVEGPSGFEELEPLREGGRDLGTLASGNEQEALFTWNPTQQGQHRLRVLVDPPERATDLLAADEIQPYPGLVQEQRECVSLGDCNNAVDRPIDVLPLQQPDLAVEVDGVPREVTAGEEVPLTVTVRNLGGVPSTDGELTLSENGLLPVLDTLTTDLPTIEPGGTHVLNVDWVPVTSGDVVVIANVESPAGFTGMRGDGTLASEDNTRTVPVAILKPGLSLELTDQAVVRPGQPTVVQARLVNDGTAPATVQPEATRADGVALAPILDAPQDLAPGTETPMRLLAFASAGTAPGTRAVGIAVQPDAGTVDVTVAKRPAVDVALETRQLDTGENPLEMRVTNTGNVPLAGDLSVAGPGIRGNLPVELGVDETRVVPVDVTVAPGTPAGPVDAAINVWTEDLHAREEVTLTVESGPAIQVDAERPPASLRGTVETTVNLTNVGNAPLTGSATVDGNATLVSSPLVEIEPGERASLDVSWTRGVGAPGSLVVTTVEGTAIVDEQLPRPADPSKLQVTDVSVRPSVNLQEGQEVTVVATIENLAEHPMGNATVGFTVDGELLTTNPSPALEPGEAALVEQTVTLPHPDTVTLGAVHLEAFQAGLTGGKAVSVDVGEGLLRVMSQTGTPKATPGVALPGILALLALAAVAGVRRR